jgi:hypothetical protein
MTDLMQQTVLPASVTGTQTVEKEVNRFEDLAAVPLAALNRAAGAYQRHLMDKQPELAQKTGFVPSLANGQCGYYVALPDSSDGNARFFICTANETQDVATGKTMRIMRLAGVATFDRTVTEGLSDRRKMTEQEVDRIARGALDSFGSYVSYTLEFYRNGMVVMHYKAPNEPHKGHIRHLSLSCDEGGVLFLTRTGERNEVLDPRHEAPTPDRTLQGFFDKSGIAELRKLEGQRVVV